MRFPKARSLLLASASSIAIAAGAFTNDAKAQVPVYNWTGFYVGINAGVGLLDHQQVHLNEDGLCGDFSGAICSLGKTGPVFGIHTGYLWQSGMIAFGIEGDLSLAALASTVSGGCCGQTFTGNVDALASIRGRVGVVHNAIYAYLTGGIGFGHLKSGWQNGYGSTLDTWKAGPVIGAGFEYALTPRASIRTELLYYDFGTVSSTFVPICCGTYTTQFKHTVTTARVGLTVKW